MLSFCFFFFVNNFFAPVNNLRRGVLPTPWIVSGLASGYGFPGCIPVRWTLRPRPLGRDWKHPGPVVADPIPDSLMGRQALACQTPCIAASMRTVGVL